MRNQPKPGSSSEDARKIGGRGDFGAPESDVIERNYTSANTRRSDPGSAEPHGGISRDTGVGGNASGPGSSSGGDLDTDFVGVGNGQGLSQSGPDKNYLGGPDEAQPNSNKPDRKPPSPSQDLNRPGAGQSTIMPPSDNVSSISQGADAATNPAARHDDSFAADVSRDESSGRNSR